MLHTPYTTYMLATQGHVADRFRSGPASVAWGPAADGSISGYFLPTTPTPESLTQLSGTHPEQAAEPQWPGQPVNPKPRDPLTSKYLTLLFPLKKESPLVRLKWCCPAAGANFWSVSLQRTIQAEGPRSNTHSNLCNNSAATEQALLVVVAHHISKPWVLL